MEANRILSLLGLALRGNHLVVGEEPVEAVARARDARVLLLASDAADNTRRRVEHFADAGQCIWLRVPFTKEEIGRAVGRSSAAIVAVTDIGLANAVVHRLAELDPKRYEESAKRMEIKAQRAAQRKAEQLAHEKNVRMGKHKPKAQPAEQEAAPEKKSSDKKPSDKKAFDKKTSAPVRKTGSAKPGYKKAGEASKSRPSKENRPKPRAKTNRFAGSRPVKKGKGSFRKKDD